MVVQRQVARQQLAEAAEQVFEPEIGANAFVERVFVQDHAQAFADWRES